MSKPSISVSDFYQNTCVTKKLFSELSDVESKATVFADAIKSVCESYLKGEKFSLKAFLEEHYKEDFFAFSWQKDTQIADDIKKVGRFFKYLKGNCVAANVPVAAELSDVIITSRVNLIIKDDEGYTAYILKGGKANKSPFGKSIHTSTKTDLSVLCAKKALEKDYKGIKVALVYLSNDADTFGNVGDFVVSNTKKSNIFINDFAEFRGVDELTAKIAEVYAAKPQADCYNCYKKQLCSKSTVKSMKVSKALVEEKESTYKVPSFTKTQKQVVDFVDGSMLVVAGPGSGKTATLIGRGVNLIRDHKVDPDFILAITFTNKAAGELKERFKAALSEAEAPCCCTIHSLALQILMQNKNIVGEVSILSTYERMEILRELADGFDRPLKGFNYGSGKEGKTAFLKTLSNRIDALSADAGAFGEKYPDIDGGFYELYGEFKKIVKARGFYTFDEVIKACVTLFDEHADILRKYQSMYKYIMVDEFQDIDGWQAKFIYSLAEHGNIVVVGDDDQSIYGFRGGSNKYMLNFQKTFEGAKVVVLDKNFRSNSDIVAASEKLISGNKERIPKKVDAVRESADKSIVEIDGQEAETLTKVVGKLLKSYSYDDMAVLSTKNSTIEELADTVNFPVTLGRSYLIKNPVFLIMLDLLKCFSEGSSENLIHYLMMMGLDDSSIKDLKGGDGKISVDALKVLNGENEKSALSLYEQMRFNYENGCSAFYFVDEVVSFFSLEASSVAAAFDEMLETKHLRSLDALKEAMEQMVSSEDETKLMPDRAGSVLFLTSHEAKGMEFPVVILVDDFKQDGKEETNRLFYVAMTRPKERLVVLKKRGEHSLIEKAN